MSDSILVRVTLDSYDVARRTKGTQVYVQIPEVARASWLLPAEDYERLRDAEWGDVLDAAIKSYAERWIASDTDSANAREAVGKWLKADESQDALNQAWFQARARRDPVSRSLLRDKERLLARVAELEAERHSTNEALDDAVQCLRERQAEREVLAERLRAGQQWQRGRNPELVSENLVSQSELREIFGIPLVAPWVDGITRQIAPVQALREDEVGGSGGWCTGCIVDHAPDECGYRPEADGAS